MINGINVINGRDFLHICCYKWRDVLIAFLFHWFVDGCLSQFHIIAVLQQTNNKLVCKYLFHVSISLPSHVYPEVGQLSHIAGLFLVFWGSFVVFHNRYTNLHPNHECLFVPVFVCVCVCNNILIRLIRFCDFDLYFPGGQWYSFIFCFCIDF